MVKELVFHLNSNTEVETLLDRLEERVDLKKASLEDSFGYSLRNDDRSLEIQVFPKQGGEHFEVVVRTWNDKHETLSKQIFGKPKKETMKDASILDIAEYIAELPQDYSEIKIKKMLKEKFELNDDKFLYFKEMILKQGSRDNARDYLKNAAERFH
ncbi:MAG: hypothetical protein HZR80_15885 [Candidatus Heimdallarchaeota archaeon]